jgi:hypothetical protein
MSRLKVNILKRLNKENVPELPTILMSKFAKLLPAHAIAIAIAIEIFL